MLGAPLHVHAGTIFGAPSYLGLSSGLVGYWPFNGKDISGVTAYDRSGNANNGTLTNGPTKTSGKIGQALDFNQSKFVNMGSASSLDNLGSTTVSMWIYPRSITTGALKEGTLMDKNQGAPLGWIYTICTNGDGHGLCTGATNVFAWGNHGIWHTSDNTAVFNTWQHLVVTQASNTVPTFYINGVSVALTEVSPANGGEDDSANDLTVGNRTGLDSPFDGIIDDVRVYNRALTPDEIKRLYKMGTTAKFGAPNNAGSLSNGLVGYWTFDGKDTAQDGSGKLTAYDRSGQGNNATSTGTNVPQKASGKIGQALNFDGVNDFLDPGYLSQLTGASFISASYWAKTTDQTNRLVAIGSYAGAGGAANLAFEFNRGAALPESNKLWFGARDVATNELDFYTTNTTNAMDGQWHHVVAIFDFAGATGQIYLDGVSQAVSYQSQGVLTTMDALTQSVYIGALDNVGTPANYFPGSLDDVRIYNRALTPDEIKRLYKMGTAKFGASNVAGSLSQGLVGWWTFDGKDMVQDSSGKITAYDRSGQGNNATTTGTNVPVRASGKIGQGFNFDGVDDFVGASTFSWPSGGPVTVSFWNKVSSTDLSSPLGSAFGSSRGSAAQDNRFQVHAPYSDGLLYWDYGDILGAGRISVSYSNYLNKWTHVVLVSQGNGGNFKAIYLDGTLVATDSTSDGPDIALTGMDIGRWNDGGSVTYHKGSVDDLRIYNRALTADEVKRLYNMGR